MIIIIIVIIISFVDPRSDDLLGMYSVWPSVAICLAYVFLVTIAGPKYMASRKPMEIKSIMIYYNFLMVAFCGYIMYEVRV